MGTVSLPVLYDFSLLTSEFDDEEAVIGLSQRQLQSYWKREHIVTLMENMVK